MGKRRSTIPEDFKVSDKVMEMAIKKGWPDPRLSLDRFKLHHQAKGSLMADWDAALCFWMSNEKGPPMKKPASPQQEMNLKPRPRQPELTEEEIGENRRRVGPLLHDLVKQFDVRKAHEKL